MQSNNSNISYFIKLCFRRKRKAETRNDKTRKYQKGKSLFLKVYEKYFLIQMKMYKGQNSIEERLPAVFLKKY